MLNKIINMKFFIQRICDTNIVVCQIFIWKSKNIYKNNCRLIDKNMILELLTEIRYWTLNITWKNDITTIRNICNSKFIIYNDNPIFSSK